MTNLIKPQKWTHLMFYVLFAVTSLAIMWYYLSYTLIKFTTTHQFPINSFQRFPLSFIVFPAEIFSFLFALYFVYCLFSDRYRPSPPSKLAEKDRTRVAILLPVYNEPADIVERTIKACKNIIWGPGIKIYLLDDSTNDADKQAMTNLAKKHSLTLVRRPDRKGYKAGNINNAIKHAVKEDYFVILDADQAPTPGFLQETMDYMSDPTIAFVQTPQHFINSSSTLERTIKIGTNIFYHAQSMAKAKDKAMPFCGTNAVIRTSVFRLVNGFSYYTATEDIELGLRMNESGFYGAYVPKILVHGYAPSDFKAYSSQQYRWANGNLAILRQSFFRILSGNFSLRQQIHIFFTLGWWLIGLTTILYILVPLISLWTGLATYHTWLPQSLLVLLFAHVTIGITMIYTSLHARLDNEKVTLKDALLQYSLITNSMFIYAQAAINALILKRYIGFVRTNKTRSASSLSQIKFNLILGAICFFSSIYALYNVVIASTLQQVRTFLPVSLWLLFYGVILISSIIFIDSTPEEKTK